MKKKILAAFTIGLFMFVMVGMAQAATFKVSFEVSNFTGLWSAAPVKTVTGSIWYDAVNSTATWQAFSNIELAIGEYTYARPDLASLPPYQTIYG